MRQIYLKGNRLFVRFNYNAELVARVKDIPGRKFHPNEKEWSIPLALSSQEHVRDLLDDWWFSITPEAKTALENLSQAVEMSYAAEADLDIKLKGELRPFQKAGVRYALMKNRALIADEPGLGKTIQAIATIEGKQAFPALIVCPASLKLNWQREIQRWTERTTTVVNGSEPFAKDAEYVIVNYDLLHRRLDELKAIPFKAMVADESHYLKNGKAKRTRTALELGKNIPLRLALTGTPVLNRPVELISQLEWLGRLEEFGGWWAFATRYCGARRTRFGLDLNGATNLEELNTNLRSTCMIRRTKSEVLKELPDKQRSIVLLELSNYQEYRQAEADVVTWLAVQAANDKEFLASIAHLPLEEQKRRRAMRAADKAYRAQKALQLVRIEALKQLSARGKLEAAQEWIGDFLETGEKLVVFANHKEIVQAIANHFGAPSITGETSVAERQKAVDAFQNDPDTRLIVLNMQAGGVGLTLTAASNVAFLELGWTPAVHDQAEDRCHRLTQKNAVTAWYLLAAGTIDEDIAAVLDEKRTIVHAITEGEELAEEGILNALIARLLEKQEQRRVA